MLITGKPDRKAGEVPVLADGVEVTRLRRVPPQREWITYAVADGAWTVECTWLGDDYQRGRVRARPADAPDVEASLLATYRGGRVGQVALDGRQLEITGVSFMRGMHRYAHDGRWLAVTGMKGFPRVRITLRADAAVPLHQQVFLLCLDLYTCRRNTTAAGALGLRSVPTDNPVG